MMDLQDHLLIAMPNLDDSYFYRSVIYSCEHNEKGSMGLVLNQPTDLSIAELGAKMNFMMVSNRTYSDKLVLAGGPVNVDRGFILHTNTHEPFDHSYRVNDNLMLTTSADVVDTFGTLLEPEQYLVALGCASWEPHQLEREIMNNSWLVVPATEQILFDLPYEERWLAANQLLGIDSHNFAGQVGHS